MHRGKFEFARQPAGRRRAPCMQSESAPCTAMPEAVIAMHLRERSTQGRAPGGKSADCSRQLGREHFARFIGFYQISRLRTVRPTKSRRREARMLLRAFFTLLAQLLEFGALRPRDPDPGRRPCTLKPATAKRIGAGVRRSDGTRSTRGGAAAVPCQSGRHGTEQQRTSAAPPFAHDDDGRDIRKHRQRESGRDTPRDTPGPTATAAMQDLSPDVGDAG